MDRSVVYAMVWADFVTLFGWMVFAVFIAFIVIVFMRMSEGVRDWLGIATSFKRAIEPMDDNKRLAEFEERLEKCEEKITSMS